MRFVFSVLCRVQRQLAGRRGLLQPERRSARAEVSGQRACQGLGLEAFKHHQQVQRFFDWSRKQHIRRIAGSSRPCDGEAGDGLFKPQRGRLQTGNQ